MSDFPEPQICGYCQRKIHCLFTAWDKPLCRDCADELERDAWVAEQANRELWNEQFGEGVER